MFVGVLRIWLRIPSARSLKDRRRVVRSFKDRVQNKLRVSVAEVGDLERHQHTVLGVVFVANAASRVDEVLAAAASMAGHLRDAVLVDRATEVLSFGTDGKGVGADPSSLDAMVLDASVPSWELAPADVDDEEEEEGRSR
ncbi:MAG: DUF503 domain-containing protein [Myxococcota bacterium]